MSRKENSNQFTLTGSFSDEFTIEDLKDLMGTQSIEIKCAEKSTNEQHQSVQNAKRNSSLTEWTPEDLKDIMAGIPVPRID